MREQEAQVPPPVAERRQFALAAAGHVLDVELLDPQALLGGADHHLGRELHAGRAEVHCGQGRATHRTHAAVSVADAGAEQEVEEAGQDRVADVLVQPRHCAGLDVVHPVAHDEVGAVLKVLHEPRYLAEVVREVGIAHHVVLAARRLEPTEVRCAVAALADVHDARASSLGQLGRAIGRVVVGHHDLAERPESRIAASAWPTQASMFSSSLRQGITTETVSSSSRCGVAEGRASVSGVVATDGTVERRCVLRPRRPAMPVIGGGVGGALGP